MLLSDLFAHWGNSQTCVLLRELGDAEQVLKVAALGQRPTLESADGKTAVLSGSDESRAAKEGEGWGGRAQQRLLAI